MKPTSYFSEILPVTEEMNIEFVAGKLSYFYEQLHLLHWQTKGYAEHMAIGSLYGYVYEFKDEVIEKLMGYTGKRPKAFKIEPLSDGISCELLLDQIESFSKQLISWAKISGYCDIESITTSLSGMVAKTKYLLTLS